MKTLSSIFLAVAIALMFSTSAYAAYNVDPSSGNDVILVSAAIDILVTLEVLSNWVDGSDHKIGFPSIDSTQQVLTVTDNPLTVNYGSNYPSWAVQCYTDNRDDGLSAVAAESYTWDDLGSITGATWSYSGLVGNETSAEDTERVGLAWHGDVDELAAQPANPLTADADFGKNWTWITDESQVAELLWDGVAARPIKPADSDFDFATDGYARILSGGGGDPLGTLLQGSVSDPNDGWEKDDNGSIVLYVGAAFYGKNPGNYDTTINFDIVHF